MSVVRRRITLAASLNVDVNLSPFDRFAGRGGSLQVKATSLLVDAGKTQLTVLIGSDIVIQAGEIPTEANVGVGPDVNSPILAQGFGAPADPITINVQTLAGHSGAGIVVEAQIVNG